VSAAPRLKVALKRGFTVRLSGLKAGKVTVTAGFRKRTVASRRVTVGSGGTASAKLRFTAKGAKALRGRKTVRLTLRAGQAAGSVTLKR
jgi:hypothetical protein